MDVAVARPTGGLRILSASVTNRCSPKGLSRAPVPTSTSTPAEPASALSLSARRPLVLVGTRAADLSWPAEMPQRTIHARGLQPRTDFTVFLLQQARSPFGAAEYIGDFATDSRGRPANRFDLTVEDLRLQEHHAGARRPELGRGCGSPTRTTTSRA